MGCPPGSSGSPLPPTPRFPLWDAHGTAHAGFNTSTIMADCFPRESNRRPTRTVGENLLRELLGGHRGTRRALTSMFANRRRGVPANVVRKWATIGPESVVSELIVLTLNTISWGSPHCTGRALTGQRRALGRWHIGPRPIGTDASVRSRHACASPGETRRAATHCVANHCCDNHVFVRMFSGWSARNHAAKSSSRIRTHRPMRRARTRAVVPHEDGNGNWATIGPWRAPLGDKSPG